jgi:hypothetical protein
MTYCKRFARRGRRFGPDARPSPLFGTGTTGAFSLVEVALALGIAAFCLTAIFGLLPVGLNSNQSAIGQTEASGLARGIAADLRAAPATPGGGVTSSRYRIFIPAPAGSASGASFQIGEDGYTCTPGSSNRSPKYRATIVFSPPPACHKTATGVHLKITWPALADPDLNKAPVHYSGSFEIVTALDRN